MNLNDLGDLQSKLILGRIHQVEKNFSHLSDALSGFVRKESRVRDKTDEIANVLKAISENEQYSSSTAKSLENFANGLTFVADHQTLEIQRFEEKIIQDLIQYQTICKNARDEIKSQVVVRDRELSKRKQLDISRRLKNENDVILSNMQISKTLKEIATIAEQFETHKISDFKEILTNFILIKMKYHASCLEVLTMVHEDVAGINEKDDSQKFKKHLQQNDKPNSRFFLSRFKSQSLGALSSILDKKPMREKSATKRYLKSISKSTMSLNSLDSNDTAEVRKESRPQSMEMSADSIETKTSEESDESESESDETVEDEKPSLDVKPQKQVHQVKRFQ